MRFEELLPAAWRRGLELSDVHVAILPLPGDNKSVLAWLSSTYPLPADLKHVKRIRRVDKPPHNAEATAKQRLEVVLGAVGETCLDQIQQAHGSIPLEIRQVPRYEPLRQDEQRLWTDTVRRILATNSGVWMTFNIAQIVANDHTLSSSRCGPSPTESRPGSHGKIEAKTQELWSLLLEKAEKVAANTACGCVIARRCLPSASSSLPAELSDEFVEGELVVGSGCDTTSAASPISHAVQNALDLRHQMTSHQSQKASGKIVEETVGLWQVKTYHGICIDLLNLQPSIQPGAQRYRFRLRQSSQVWTETKARQR